MQNLVSSNKATVKGDSNLVLQNSTVGTVLMTSGDEQVIGLLSQLGEYKLIQQKIKRVLSLAEEAHPLFPVFSAKYNSKLDKLISTPETEDALQKYPKRIQGAFEIDYKKYPYMDKSETPWDYAYRTQTEVELKTTAYKEYLGDMEDPFPTMEYTDGMVTVIKAPGFPEAICASVESGDISVPVMLKRVPCLEYGKLTIATVSDTQGFNLKITVDIKAQKTDLLFTKNGNTCVDLKTQLLREKLLSSIFENKFIKVMTSEGELMSGSFSDSELNGAIFKNAALLVQYIENLLYIEDALNCRFLPEPEEITAEDYYIAFILAASIQNKWLVSKVDFDNSARCSYDRISESFFDKTEKKEICYESKEVKIVLQGVTFFVEKLIVVYTDARVNNLNSIKKNILRKKKDILITVKPIDGKDKLTKHIKLEGVGLENLKEGQGEECET